MRHEKWELHPGNTILKKFGIQVPQGIEKKGNFMLQQRDKRGMAI